MYVIQMILGVSTVHLIKKLTSMPVCTGTDELCTTVWVCYGYGYQHCISHIVQLKSKQDGSIHSVRQFTTLVGSGMHADHSEKRQL